MSRVGVNPLAFVIVAVIVLVLIAVFRPHLIDWARGISEERTFALKDCPLRPDVDGKPAQFAHCENDGCRCTSYPEWKTAVEAPKK